MFEIVCPDEIVRHYPYTNRDDADDDASLAAADCSLGYEKRSPLELLYPKCRGGSHRVRETTDA